MFLTHCCYLFSGEMRVLVYKYKSTGRGWIPSNKMLCRQGVSSSNVGTLHLTTGVNRATLQNAFSDILHVHPGETSLLARRANVSYFWRWSGLCPLAFCTQQIVTLWYLVVDQDLRLYYSQTCPFGGQVCQPGITTLRIRMWTHLALCSPLYSSAVTAAATINTEVFP